MAHVLVVDDHQEVRSVVRCMLEDAGHTVVEAAHGAEAVALLRTSPIPLVALVDLRLTAEAAENAVLTALAGDPALAARHVVVWMTGMPLEQAEQATIPVRRYGVRLLAKPFDLDGLTGMIAEAARDLPGGDGATGEGAAHPVAEPGLAPLGGQDSR